jgi:very-short-patch-repair endonuclease
MVWEKHQNLSSAGAWALTGRQHGVVTRRQLLDLGLTPRAIEHRLAIGRIHRIERGIYAVGRRQLGQRGRWMAAVLCCGSRAALSHRSAAALWGIGAERAGRIEVSVPFASPRHRPGTQVYRRPSLRGSDVTTEDGIPITIPVLTVIDLARILDRGGLERTVNEADRIGLVDPDTLLHALDEFPGRHGVRRLREILGRQVFRLTDSELERRFMRLISRVGLPLPLTGHWLNGFKVDFHWPDLGLVVETDGLRYHRTPAQQTRDRERDQAHTAAGLTPLRFTHSQIRYEGDRVGEILLAVVRRLEGSQRGTEPDVSQRGTEPDVSQRGTQSDA